MSLRPDLVIFDCDGVLVDSEPLAEQSMRAGLEELGLPMTPQEIRSRFRGLSMKTVVGIIGELRGEPVPEDWLAHQQDRDWALFKRNLKAVPGIENLINALKKSDLPYCVASSGSLEKMRFTLGITGLLTHVESVLFSAGMVERGKPFPDLFLHAASRMGADPKKCVVIEDSVAGVKAAQAADIRVLAYAGSPAANREGMSALGAELFDAMPDVSALIGLRD
jgi:HAD superfamily hydrolase (TIGR01509 family)